MSVISQLKGSPWTYYNNFHSPSKIFRFISVQNVWSIRVNRGHRILEI